MDQGNFKELKLSKEMLHNLQRNAYLRMTPVQEAAIPPLLQKKDLIVQAKTGSGKTAAFGIGILENLRVQNFYIQSLIICPTRELADQVAKELRTLAKFKHNIKILTLCGGVSFGPQLGSLRHGAHIVVGTPGRLLKHLKKETLHLNRLESVILDEADRILDMGFIEDLEEIFRYVPQKRQTLLFSATFTDEIISMSEKIQSDALHIQTKSLELPNKIHEIFYSCKHKQETLISVLAKFSPEKTIVFVNTKLQGKELSEYLVNNKIDALVIHGDLEQYERNDILVQFANGSCPVLVATDLAARGLDIDGLDLVINYDLPSTQDVYTHRIGRTGRAGKEGFAISLYEANESIEIYKNQYREFLSSHELHTDNSFEMKPKNITLVIEGGKKEKLRAGDILGALTAGNLIKSQAIGKIDIYDKQSYVAIQRDCIDKGFEILSHGRIKNKKFSVWIL